MLTHTPKPKVNGLKNIILWKTQNTRCFYCDRILNNIGYDRKTTNGGYTRDHFFPRAWGNILQGNCVLACHKCNGHKGDMLPGRDDVIKFIELYENFEGNTFVDLTEFKFHQLILDYLESLVGPRVDTKYII